MLQQRPLNANNNNRITEIKDIFPSKDAYFRYFGPSPDGLARALSELTSYLDEEGPFDGVFAFSQGGSLIATYLLQLAQRVPHQQPPFRCIIFFSSTRPFDPQALSTRGVMQWLEDEAPPPPAPCADADSVGSEDSSSPPVIRLPTAHIWGRKDSQYAAESEVVLGYCDKLQRVAYVHGGGHEIPGPRAKDDVQGAVRAIRRVVDMAEREI
jgi:pimeloyl-ACP methyl ester carboxylesterase